MSDDNEQQHWQGRGHFEAFGGPPVQFIGNAPSAVWLTSEQIEIEKLAIRLASVSPLTFGNAVLILKRFYVAGGDEELFTKLQRVALEKGHDLAQLLCIIDDCNLLQRR